MRRRTRRAIPYGAALVIVIALLALYSAEPDIIGVVDFYAIAREASLSELVQVADKTGNPLYLPSALPPGFKLTAIYLHEDEPLKEGEILFFISIVVYSAEGNKDYKTAELGIQITLGARPTYKQMQAWTEKSKYVTVLRINDWPVRLNERASTGGNEERRAKYGEYQLLVEVWIKAIAYTISPMTLTPDEAIQLVRSMRPIS